MLECFSPASLPLFKQRDPGLKHSRVTTFWEGRQALQDDGLRKRLYFWVVFGPVNYKRVVIVFPFC